MNEIAVSKRYAQALLALGVERECVEILKSELQEVKKIFDANLKMQKFLKQPFVSPDEKKTLIQNIFGTGVRAEILDFMKLLIDKKRINLLPDICVLYSELADKNKGIVRVKAHAPYPLNDLYKNQIIEAIGNIYNSRVELDYVQDAGIIGGVVLKINDTIIDGSLSGKLKAIKEELIVYK